MRCKLTPAFIAKATPRKKDASRTGDTQMPCFGFVITAAGHRSFVVQYRVAGRSRRMNLRATTLSDARDQAKALLGDVAKGRVLRQPVDPLAERRRAEAVASGAGTFRAIATDWYNREGKKHRSGKHRFAEIERLAFPKLGSRLIGDIKRSDIVKLLDTIEDTNGPSMADYVLSAIRRVMSWHDSRDDDFMSPIRRGMARTKERARDRILTDDEVRAVWRAAEATSGPYGSLIKFLLLTCARREEAAQMTRSELSGTEWTIPGSRYKTKLDHLVPLSAAAMAVIEQLPRIGRADFVFTVSGRVPISSFTQRKIAFDRACGVTGWTLHDLRRTARSLLSRAGIDADTAERCLGHVIGGVRGVYDRREYREEKARAFEVLAQQIGRIITPTDNVIPMPERRVSQVPG
jgi:integrase